MYLNYFASESSLSDWLHRENNNFEISIKHDCLIGDKMFEEEIGEHFLSSPSDMTFVYFRRKQQIKIMINYCWCHSNR